MTDVFIYLLMGFLAGSFAIAVIVRITDRPDPVAAQEEYYDLLLEKKYGEWVPVSEQLPEVSGHYLVTLAKNEKTGIRGIPAVANVVIDRYNCTANRWEVYDRFVVAWMVPPRGYRK